MQLRSHRAAPTATHLRQSVLAALLGCAAAMAHSDAKLGATSVERHYLVPLFVSTANPAREGLLRIINRSDHAGVVEIQAIDDAGTRLGPVTLALEAGAVHHLHPGDLEWGDQDHGGVGGGQGDWRLELVTALDIAPLAYVRNAAGGVSHVDAVSIVNNGGICAIPFFNPSGHQPEHSRLRLTNPGPEPAWVTIAGLDDAGLPAPDGDVRLTVPPGATRTVTADELESGAADLEGRLGDGTGRWRLSVSSSAHVDVVNLLVDGTGACPSRWLRAASDAGLPRQCRRPPRRRALGHGLLPTGSVGHRRQYATGHGLVWRRLRRSRLHVGARRRLPDDGPPAPAGHPRPPGQRRPCEAWLTDTLEFDLTPLQELHGGTGTVVLALAFADGTERELRYTF